MVYNKKRKFFISLKVKIFNLIKKLLFFYLFEGIGLMTWSPVSFGLCPIDKSDDATQFFIKLANKVIFKILSRHPFIKTVSLNLNVNKIHFVVI